MMSEAVRECAISSALEEYLEAIYVLSEDKQYVRTTDISRYLNISKPSVNRAVNALKDFGYVYHEPYGDVFLTDTGRAEGAAVFKRHHIIKRFLVSVLHIPTEDAEREAGSIERGLGQYTVYRMSEFMKNNA